MNEPQIYSAQFASHSLRSTRIGQWLSITLAVLIFSAFAGAAAHAADPVVQTEAQIQTVNINQASAEELAAALEGVGMSKAQAIIEYRDSNGSFERIDQLTEVKGIGAATLAKNEGRFSL